MVDLPVAVDRPAIEDQDQDRFSCDLVANARLHVLFLRTVHLSGVSLRRPSPESLRRYSTLWLPLVIASKDTSGMSDTECNSGGGLIPPIDIAWLWHCHRLAPYDYGRYVRKVIERVCGGGQDSDYLDADPPFALQHPNQKDDSPSCMHGDAARRTRELWTERYPGEPFFLQEDKDDSDQDDSKIDGTLDGFDLLGSAERQATFLWQVTQERFSDGQFLIDGEANYYKFLNLRATEQGKNQIIVPTYQIDLLWHTHILSSLNAYDADCKSIMGRTLHHDDSLNDRAEGSTLDVAFRATRKIWQETYGEDYIVCGGMYRGEPPKEYFETDWAIPGIDEGDNTIDMKMKWPVLHPEIEGTKMNGHRIMGASSTPTPTWLVPGGNTPDGRPCYIDAAEKSTRRGLNNNPQKDDYVFGAGPMGTGYYHIETKEAVAILMGRVTRRIQAKEADLSFVSCWTCVCPCVKSCLDRKEKINTDLEDLVEVREVLRARLSAEVPLGVVGLPDEVTKNPEKKERINRYYGDGGVWLYPVYFYDAGGGCGATINDLGWGAGCGGGGSCGAGGCGGGGCGGGGCGGGGCGGGGCGG